MAKLTWRGPDDYEAGETPPSSCTWNGITFPVGVAVEVDNPTMIAKAGAIACSRWRMTQAAKTALTQWREPATEADPADVSFFDDPPEVPLDMPDCPRSERLHARTTRRKKNPSASPGARATR